MTKLVAGPVFYETEELRRTRVVTYHSMHCVCESCLAQDRIAIINDFDPIELRVLHE